MTCCWTVAINNYIKVNDKDENKTIKQHCIDEPMQTNRAGNDASKTKTD